MLAAGLGRTSPWEGQWAMSVEVGGVIPKILGLAITRKAYEMGLGNRRHCVHCVHAWEG